MLNKSLRDVCHLGPTCSTQLGFRAGNETTEGKVNPDFQVATLGAAVTVLLLYVQHTFAHGGSRDAGQSSPGAFPLSCAIQTRIHPRAFGTRFRFLLPRRIPC